MAGRKRLLFKVSGGIADHFMARPSIYALREIHSRDEWELNVSAIFPEVFGVLRRDGTWFSVDACIDNLFDADVLDRFSTNPDKILSTPPWEAGSDQLTQLHKIAQWAELNGVNPIDLNREIPFCLTNYDIQVSEAVVSRLSKPVIVIVPSSGNNPKYLGLNTTLRNWPNKYWAELIDKLNHCLPTPSIIQVGQVGDSIIQGAISLVGHTTIREAISILSKADLIITVDNFALHVAKLFSVPCIVIWGPTSPYSSGFLDQFNLYSLIACPEVFCHRPFYSLQDYHRRNMLFSSYCDHACMNSIFPDIVFTQVVKVLNLKINN